MQRPAGVPDVITYSAAICACEKGPQHQQVLHFLRAMRRHVIVLNAITYEAAISACKNGASSTSRP